MRGKDKGREIELRDWKVGGDIGGDKETKEEMGRRLSIIWS